MQWVIWIGTAMTVAGFAGIVWSIIAVTRLKRAGLDDDELRARLGRVLPLNMGALLLSVLGLMLVVVGIILG